MSLKKTKTTGTADENLAVPPVVGTRQEWYKARLALLEREKELTKLKDELAQARRELPAVEVSESYRFVVDEDGTTETLADLFGGHSQLIIQHLMMGPSWDEACKSCSFWADAFSGSTDHLPARDTAFVAVSRAPISKINAFKQRMGWTFKWVSSLDSQFNFDYRVSFTEEQKERGIVSFNFKENARYMSEEAPGVSTFTKYGDTVYHTNSVYARGLDELNPAYMLLDLTHKGRNENGLPWTMAWVRHRDSYSAKTDAEDATDKAPLAQQK